MYHLYICIWCLIDAFDFMNHLFLDCELVGMPFRFFLEHLGGSDLPDQTTMQKKVKPEERLGSTDEEPTSQWLSTGGLFTTNGEKCPSEASDFAGYLGCIVMENNFGQTFGIDNFWSFGSRCFVEYSWKCFADVGHLLVLCLQSGNIFGLCLLLLSLWVSWGSKSKLSFGNRHVVTKNQQTRWVKTSSKKIEGHNFTDELLFFCYTVLIFLLRFTKHHHDQKISLSQTCSWMFQVELPCEVCKANWPGIIRTSVCLQKTWSGMLGG